MSSSKAQSDLKARLWAKIEKASKSLLRQAVVEESRTEPLKISPKKHEGFANEREAKRKSRYRTSHRLNRLPVMDSHVSSTTKTLKGWDCKSSDEE